MSDIDSNVADMNRLLKVYETFDAESQTAKVLDAEIDRLADAIDAEAERAPWMPMPLDADWLDQVDPRDPQSRTHRETAAARIAAKSVSEEVEALARRQVTGEASYWSRFMPAHSNAKLDFDGMTGDNQQAVCEGIRWVLASLADAGRLVPAGGMALTAEQVEDVRTMLWSPGVTALDAFRRLRALFPAAEPAEQRLARNPETVTRIKSALASTEGDTEIPTPAEPAEEETKAELCAVRLCVLPARHSGVHADSRGLRWNNPASSPVVPAPAETGPWETWQEVPEGVQYYGINGWGPTYYVNRGGVRYRVFDDTPSNTADYIVQNFAPFVAAEEG